MKKIPLFLALAFLSVALTFCASTSKQRKLEAESRLRLGIGHLQDGKVAAALAELDKADKLDPSNPDIQHGIGLVHFKRGDLELAENNNLGLLYGKMGNSKKAIEYYKKTLDDVLYQTPERAYNNLGAEYEKLNRSDEAVEMYMRAVSISPTFPPPHFNLGRIYSEKGDFDRAIMHFNKAVKLNPGYVSAYFQLGSVYLKKKEYDRALDSFKKVLEITESEEVKRMAREYIELIER
jgi:tetratricopeptide (TPR) repeat protein